MGKRIDQSRRTPAREAFGYLGLRFGRGLRGWAAKGLEGRRKGKRGRSNVQQQMNWSQHLPGLAHVHARVMVIHTQSGSQGLGQGPCPPHKQARGSANCERAICNNAINNRALHMVLKLAAACPFVLHTGQSDLPTQTGSPISTTLTLPVKSRHVCGAPGCAAADQATRYCHPVAHSFILS